MRLKRSVAIGVVCLLGGVAHGDPKRDLRGNPRGLEPAFLDVIPKKFVADWPDAGRALVPSGLDLLLFPGGEACDVADSATPGPATQFITSSDGKQLVAVTTVKLDRRTAKLLGKKADGGKDATTALVVVDGPSGKTWSAILASGPGCDRGVANFRATPDGKRILASLDDEWVLIDLPRHSVRLDERMKHGLPSPHLLHVAGLTPASGDSLFGQAKPNGDRLQIDGEMSIWGDDSPGAGARIGRAEWLSDTSLVFCGSNAPGTVMTKHRVDLASGALPNVQAIGPCPPEVKP